MPGGGVHHEKGLMRRTGDQLLRRTTHLFQLGHQSGLVVQAACRVHDNDIHAAGFTRGERVIERGAGISTLPRLDDVHV